MNQIPLVSSAGNRKGDMLRLGGICCKKNNKPGTGTSLHTQEPVTVASFRTWRGWREYVA